MAAVGLEDISAVGCRVAYTDGVPSMVPICVTV